MKRCIKIGMLLICLLFLSGCEKGKDSSNSNSYDVYYLNKEETKVISEIYVTEETQKESLVEELLTTLQTTPENLQSKAPIVGQVKLLSYQLEEDQLLLKFDEHYKELIPTTEVLVRAAIVRTMTQIEGINYVVMQIRDENLTDVLGNPVGVMTAEMFIDNAGDEINSYEKAKIRLYFADEGGTRLIEAIRDPVYNTNISMEKLVVEQLILGPKNPDIFPTINPETKINSVTVKDGICYVNLNEKFLTQIYNVSADVTLYSITNSLVELPNVNKVQISINGETEIMFREKTKLTTIFERNLELVGRKSE